MPNPTDTPATKKPAKTIDKPAEAEPKQRPVKRPPRPAYHVPRGVAFTDTSGEPRRYRAGSTIDEGILPGTIARDYLKRGDIVELTDH